MVDVLTSILINAPIARVAAYASNPDNASEWYKNIGSAEWVTSNPLSVGSRIAFKAKFMGRSLAYIYEVMEMSDTRFVMRTVEGPFPMETTYEWESVSPTVTKMTLRNRGNPAGFSALFSPFMRMMMRRANQKDLEKIKQMLEQ